MRKGTERKGLGLRGNTSGMEEPLPLAPKVPKKHCLVCAGIGRAGVKSPKKHAYALTRE